MREQRAPQFCMVVGSGTRTYILLPSKEGLSKLNVKQSGPRVTPAYLTTDFLFLIMDFLFLIPHISSSDPSNFLRPKPQRVILKCSYSKAFPIPPQHSSSLLKQLRSHSIHSDPL